MMGDHTTEAPCQMAAHGKGGTRAYCLRCGQYVNVAWPDPCPARQEGLGAALRAFESQPLPPRVDGGRDA